jgi:glucokinase
MLLVGDIGGTKTVLALFSQEKGPHESVAQKSFPSGKYDSLETIINEFLNEYPQPIEDACLGVAGPVVEGRAQITNLPWVVDAANLKSEFNLDKVKLLNDLEAIGHAVPMLKPEHLHTLSEGDPVPGGSIAVVAPGTGLGEGFLTFACDTYQVNPSEGGHVNFGPTDQTQMDLLHYLREEKGYNHVSYERVCSGGLGIPILYEFFTKTGRYTPPDWLTEALANASDDTPVIIQSALDDDRPCEVCTAVLDTFVSILAAEAGNLALKVFATGGIYLGGGIPPRIIPHLSKPHFLATLRNKGRFKDMLSEVPVHVITHINAGLLGAASFGLQ